MTAKYHFLRIDASARVHTSNSRRLGDALFGKLKSLYPDSIVQQRDLGQGLSFIDESWVEASSTPADQRSEAQQQQLALSDQLIDEIKQSDAIVLTTPMYNFGIPATLKCWIDLICRAGVTFRYGTDGAVGLLKGKRVDIIITTGGVSLGSPLDFVSTYLQQVLRFIGIEDINIIAAEQMNLDADNSYQHALDQIEQYHTVNPAA